MRKQDFDRMVNFRIDDKDYQKLALIAYNKDRAIAWTIRKAIDEYVERESE